MRGRLPIDKEARRRDKRRRVLERGLIAGLELIDGIRQEMAQLDAADRANTPAKPEAPQPPKHASDHQT